MSKLMGQRERPARREAWQRFDAEAFRDAVCNDLDELESIAADHERRDRNAFDAIRSQNRWIVVLVLGVAFQVLGTIAVWALTR